MHPFRKLLLALAALALVAAACSDDEPGVAATGDPNPVAPADTGDDAGDEEGEPASPAGDAGFPLTVEVSGESTTIEAAPEAIVSLSPAATEMLFAIGAGDLVVAADEFSDFPEEAPTTDLSGFDPNVEAVIEFEPDLVLIQNDANDLVAGLESVGIQSLILPAAADLEDSYEQIEVLGAITGHEDEADELVADLRDEIDELTAGLPERDEPLTYYHELTPGLFTATSSTFIGEIYALAGLVNIADASDADGAAGGFPQLSAEVIIEADPDIIFLADTKCCGETAETVAARPGWDQIAAVQNGAVVELDDDIASRWGPRIIDLYRAVIEAVETVEDTATQEAGA